MNRSIHILLAITIAAPLAAQQGYRQPPEPIATILDAPQTPAVFVSPDKQWMLLAERAGLPSIAELSEPELRLAGLRINPRTGGPSREITGTGLRVRAITTSGRPAERRIETPAGARIGSPLWSSDSRRVAFTITSDSAIHLWIANVATGAARRVNAPALNGAIGVPCRWIDAERLACRVILEGRGAAPERSMTPAGPVIQEAAGRAAPNRTYQDLLASPSDESLFEHYATSRVAIVSPTQPVRFIGDAGIHLDVKPSPDGRYLLVTTSHRPFSYVVPLGRFPQRIDVWDLEGKLVRRITARPLIEEMSIAFDATVPGPRAATWRTDVPATLVWSDALDAGDPARPMENRDRLLALDAPFTGEPRALLEVGYRIDDITWSSDSLALVEEGWWKTRRTRTWVIAPGGSSSAPRLLFDRSSEDRYADPGSFVETIGASGEPVLLTSRDRRFAYLSGAGASAEGDRPFLDRIELTTGKTTRLWRSQAPHYEFVVAVLDPDARQIITRRESVTEAPNYYLRDLRRNRITALTDFADPAPQFAGMTRELIRYKRADGVDLSATLYLPANYDRSRGPLPFLFWAYPQEFKSAAAAAQVRGSPYRFVRPTGASHLFALTQGYGVLDDPAMPIVGEGSAEPNDTYIEQLVAGAQAAIDEVVRRGVADRARIAIGGHSYGAFMTANLLAHSDLFRTGIARSGAYNRTLTPFGFQAEERPFWKAQETYMKMSPFTYAHQINEPLLMIHGEADNNSGTFPVQSERMFAAIKGNGGVVRYVLLPSESHGYRARESVGHVLWEMITWLDKYLKAKETATR